MTQRDALRTYASAWLAEHEYITRAEREDRCLSHSVNITPPARDKKWAQLLARKEAAADALDVRDYVDAQRLIFAAFVEQKELADAA